MSNNWIIFSALHLVLPVICIVPFVHFAPKMGIAWCTVAGTVVYQLLLFCTAMCLGHLGLLTPAHFRAVILVAAAVMLISGAKRIPGLLSIVRQFRYRPCWIDLPIAILLAAFAVLLAGQLALDWSQGPNSFDALNYHIPRALIWGWHGNLKPWNAAVWQQIGHPAGGTASLLPTIFLGIGWLGSSWTGTVLALGSAAAIYVIGRSYGINGRAALLAGLIFLSFPAVGLRLRDVSTDIAAAFPVLAGVALFRTVPSLNFGIFALISLGGLGAACKQYVVFTFTVIAMALLLPKLRSIFGSFKTFSCGVGGVVIAGAFCLLSYYPIYQAFGTFTGGEGAYTLSTFHRGIGAACLSTAVGFLIWIFEPLALLPDELKSTLLEKLYFNAAIEALSLSPQEWAPVFNSGSTRSGAVPLILLPFLVLGVKRGYRWIVAVLFLLLTVAQLAPLAINYYAPRFSLLPLAAFALLWGARAQKYTLLVCLVAIVSMAADINYMRRTDRAFSIFSFRYDPEADFYKDLYAVVGEETVFVLNAPLTVHAKLSGRLGKTRFEYVSCPPDSDWVGLFTGLKEKSRWFFFLFNMQKYVPGPAYKSDLGPRCELVHVDQIREWLSAAGWEFEMVTDDNQELWRTKNSS